jgi:GNAT superfamily N-acetyltransferase
MTAPPVYKPAVVQGKMTAPPVYRPAVVQTKMTAPPPVYRPHLRAQMQRMKRQRLQQDLQWYTNTTISDNPSAPEVNSELYVDGRLAGRAYGTLALSFNSISFGRVDVEEGYEGKGYGTKLMLNVFKAASELMNDDTEIELVADGKNSDDTPRDLRPFYTARGFEWDENEETDEETQYAMKGKLGAVREALREKKRQEKRRRTLSTSQ